MQANAKYKSSVFSLLFSDEDLLRELYCALEDVTLPPDAPVTINTLSDALFMDRINDISFEIDGKLVVLIEHQSTMNPNIPLRMLMYITRIYEKIIGDDKAIYATKPMKIPFTEFFMLYNGAEECPDEFTMRLSDMFESLRSLGLEGKDIPALELRVRVININHGRNAAIAGRCKALYWYGAFIAKARELEKELGDRTEAIKRAVRYCRDNDILKEFLERHGTEVLKMLTKEWKLEDALAVRFEEGREEGWEEGREERNREVLNLIANGYTLDDIRRELKSTAQRYVGHEGSQ